MLPTISLPLWEFSAADIEGMIAEVHNIAKTSAYSALTAMLAAWQSPYRERIGSLMHDVLSGYPAITYGVPVLLHIADTATLPDLVELPLPQHPPPDSGVLSARWLSIGTLRATTPFGQQTVPVTAAAGLIECAVLMLQCPNDTPPTLTDEWWGEVFRGIDGVMMSAPFILPWPEAVEAAAAMFATAQGSRYGGTPQLFLALEDHLLSQDAGRRFREKVQAAQ